MCVDDEVLSAYADGELREPWKSQVAKHLETCGSCREKLAEFRSLDARLKAATLGDADVEEREARVLDYFERTRLGKPKKAVPFWERKVRLLPAISSCAAAFVIVFLGGFALFGTDAAQTERILPGVAAPVDSQNVRQVSDVKPASLDSYSVEEIAEYLEKKGYEVRLKTITPVK